MYKYIILFMIIPLSLSGQTQIGNSISGEAAFDRCGYWLANSGNGEIVAVGSYWNDNNGTNSGHVRIFELINDTWVQKGNDIDGEYAGDESGFSLDISDNGLRVAIGSIRNDDNGPNSGHVRIFDWNGNEWVQVGTDINGMFHGDQFGRSIALSSDGTRVAIGANWSDCNGSNSGEAVVYELNSAQWVIMGNRICGEFGEDEFGNSISLSDNGNILAVGGRLNNGQATDAGHVRIYNWDGNNWIQLGSDIDGTMINEQFGRSIALDSTGLKLVVGAPQFTNNQGVVRVFQWDSNVYSWVQVGNSILGDENGDQFGWDVSISNDGEIIAVGSPLGTVNENGYAKVFYLNNGWSQYGCNIEGANDSDRFGWNVSLSNNGKILAISSILNNDNGQQSGHVRIYEEYNYLVNFWISQEAGNWYDSINNWSLGHFPNINEIVKIEKSDTITLLNGNIMSAFKVIIE